MWAQKHPDWEVVLWGDEDLDWLENRRLYDEAEQYVPNDAVGQFRSDIARYEILFLHGGVYIDMDTEPLKPIDDLISVPLFAVWEVEGTWIANGIMGSEAGNDFMRKAVERLPRSCEKHRGRPATYLSGPRYITALYGDFSPDMTIYPTEYFLPYLHSDIVRGSNPELEEYPNSYAVHHWNHRRSIRGMQWER